MEQGSNELKLKAVDVLLSMVTHDSRPLRDFLLQQPSQTLFGLLMRCALRQPSAALLQARARAAGW